MLFGNILSWNELHNVNTKWAILLRTKAFVNITWLIYHNSNKYWDHPFLFFICSWLFSFKYHFTKIRHNYMKTYYSIYIAVLTGISTNRSCLQLFWFWKAELSITTHMCHSDCHSDRREISINSFCTISVIYT